jgi:Ca2+/Na+ antiporter
MEILFPLIAVLVLLGFLFKGSFLPRWEAADVSLALAVFVWLAIPWLTRQTACTIEQWTSDPSRVLDGAVCLVLEVAVMILFCFTAPTGRLRFLRFIPGLLAFPAVVWVWSQVLFSRPGLDFGRLAWVAALATLAVALGGTALIRRLVPDEPSRLEGLFLINLFLLLLTIAATGAITF